MTTRALASRFLALFCAAFASIVVAIEPAFTYQGFLTDQGQPAAEDHDAAEIDHAVINGRTIRWNGAGGGAVGRLKLRGITAQVEEAIEAFGPGAEAGMVAQALREAYREDRTLAEATRHFIHALFGQYGLVILDGDDPALKRFSAPSWWRNW